ncbi:MAG: PAS domain S-box protein, partial [Mariniphaga sp.]
MNDHSMTVDELIREVDALKQEVDNLKTSLDWEVTARGKAENDLVQSKAWKKSLFQSNHSVILIVDPASGAIVEANPAACHYYGWTHTELCSKNISQINTLTPEEISTEMQLAKAEKRNHFLFKHLLSNGEIRDVEVFSGPIQFNNSDLLYSHIQDITDRIKSDENLRQSSQKWEAIMATSADGIGMASLDGKILLLSDKIVALYGYSPQEKEKYIGSSFLNFIDPAYHGTLIDNLQKLIEGKEDSKVREYLGVRKDNSRFYLELYYTVLYDGNGKPENILFFQRDISERKNAEHILLESEKKFKLIIESQAEGIGVVNQDEIFEFVNPAAARIFETSAEELVGLSLFDFLSQDEINKIHNQTASRRDGKTNDYELQIVTKNGIKKYIDVSSSPKFDENRNYKGAYGIIRDITDRKLAQEALKEKTALLSNLIINMQEGILLEDSYRRIVLTNQLFCNMFSIPAPPELLVGADCSDSAEQSKDLFKHPEQFLAQIIRILADKKAVLNDELELADGRYFERDYIPTYLDNAYNGHLWKYRDITDRKLSEKKINQQNERLNAIITAMPDLILVLDQE